jgi:hypothetical protein
LSAQFYAEIAHRQPLILGFCPLLAFGAFRMPPTDNFIGIGEQWLDHLLEGHVARIENADPRLRFIVEFLTPFHISPLISVVLTSEI